MTQENKELLLLIDLCGRLPYKVKCQWDTYYNGILTDVCKCKTKDGFVYWDCYFEECEDDVPIEIVKPYLRPMSSITKEEKEEIKPLFSEFTNEFGKRELVVRQNKMALYQDWLNAHHFDYRGLIERGLALEAPKKMYNIKEQ